MPAYCFLHNAGIVFRLCLKGHRAAAVSSVYHGRHTTGVTTVIQQVRRSPHTQQTAVIHPATGRKGWYTTPPLPFHIRIKPTAWHLQIEKTKNHRSKNNRITCKTRLFSLLLHTKNQYSLIVWTIITRRAKETYVRINLKELIPTKWINNGD